jgi:hypothetical protein
MAHGTNGLLLAYGIVFAGLVIGLIRSRAPWGKLLLSPLVAAPLTLLTGLLSLLLVPLERGLGIEEGGVVGVVLVVAWYFGMGYLFGHFIGSRGSSRNPVYVRGAIVSTIQQFLAGRDKQQPTGITLAGIPVSLQDESKHFKLIGTTGTGKSTAIQEILTAALARGDRAIIADPDGGYLRRFYDRNRDVILNPFDADAHKWDLFGEIANDYDVEQLARSMIPDFGGDDRIWSEYARTFLTALLNQAINSDTRDDQELYRSLTSAPLCELRLMLEGTPAAPFVEEGNEKMFRSIHTVASNALRVLKYTTRQQAALLSVRQWVRQGASKHEVGNGGVLFLPYKAGEIAALASLIAAWLRLGIFEAMDRDEGDQRLWFVVDELDALGHIDGLKDALARLRKFGGRCILGFQSIAQVSGTYGKGAAETIVENCGNTLILRCSASERGGTSEFASKLIGQHDVVHKTNSRSRTSRDWTETTTTSEHLRTEPAVMASEIERLPDLTGYLKIASIPDWLAVTLIPIKEPAKPRARRAATMTSSSEPVSDPATLRPSVPPAPVPEPTAPAPNPLSAPNPASTPTPAPPPHVTTGPRKPRAATLTPKPKRPRRQKISTPQLNPARASVENSPTTSPDTAAPIEDPSTVQNLTTGAQSPP